MGHGKSCQCDMNCKNNEDCCNDFTKVCQGSNANVEDDVHMYAANTNSTKQSRWNSDNLIHNCSSFHQGDCKDKMVSSTSCAGSCGNFVPGKSCQCDSNCKNTGDCCVDYADLCQKPERRIENEEHEVYVIRKAPLPNQRIRSSEIEVEESKALHGTCVGNCYQFNPHDTCQCDSLCMENGDCCQDFTKSCTQTS